MPTTPTTADWPADVLRAAAEKLRAARFSGAITATPTVAALIGARRPLAAWLESWSGVDLSEHGPMPEDAQHALAVARQLLGTTTGQPETEAPATVCICGHGAVQHFEDVCQVCDCGDYIEPQDAREVIARWRQEALSKRDLRRAAPLREAADIAEGLRQFDPAYGARKAAQISENAGLLRAADALRRLADEAAAEVQPPTKGEVHVTAERDCLAMAVMFALQWKPDAPMSLRDGIEEILATMPARSEPAAPAATKEQQ